MTYLTAASQGRIRRRQEENYALDIIDDSNILYGPGIDDSVGTKLYISGEWYTAAQIGDIEELELEEQLEETELPTKETGKRKGDEGTDQTGESNEQQKKRTRLISTAASSKITSIASQGNSSLLNILQELGCKIGTSASSYVDQADKTKLDRSLTRAQKSTKESRKAVRETRMAEAEAAVEEEGLFYAPRNGSRLNRKYCVNDSVSTKNRRTKSVKYPNHRRRCCPPEFNPEAKGQTVETWCRKVDELRAVYKWSEEATIYFAMSKLRGLAEVWYKGLPSVNFTWTEWKEKLELGFPSKRNYHADLQAMMNRTKRGIYDNVVKTGASAGNHQTPESLYGYLTSLTTEKNRKSSAKVSGKNKFGNFRNNKSVETTGRTICEEQGEKGIPPREQKDVATSAAVTAISRRNVS
ncbi:hypothetical protein NQ318_022883 [Aromia moschata]|uniref:Retrotransposon gag domain-containing protein n=1 Tax=Aromia moschata TaxID=1265417 RepID=A0AAV8XXW7_9CUCU|nr:hypothetical protein NQ318_022883 [Aromia moschata]